MSRHNSISANPDGDLATEEDIDVTDITIEDVCDVGIDDVFDTDTDDPPVIDTTETATLRLENIGGIDTAEVTLQRGISVLSGRNATNRTSALRGLCAVLGAEEVVPPAETMSTDASSGKVELTLDNCTYSRSYERLDGGSIRTDGDPFVETAGTVDAFVALLESNPARTVVQRGADGDSLRDVLMRPVDTYEIERRIGDVERTRRRVEDRLETIENEQDRLPTLEERREEIAAELDSVEEEIRAIENRVDKYDASERRAERAEELLEELQGLRTELAETEDKVSYHNGKVDEYRKELDEVESRIDEFDVPEEELDRVSDEIDRLERRKRGFEDTVADLDAIIGVNEDLATGNSKLVSATTDGQSKGTDTVEELTGGEPPETVECWTCGSRVQRSVVQDHVQTLRDLREEKRDEIEHLEARIDDLNEDRESIESTREEYRDLQSRAETLRRQIDHHTSRVTDLNEEMEVLREGIAELQLEVEETEELRESDLVEAYQRLSELEYERGRLEGDLDDVEAEIETVQDLVDERDELEDARRELTDTLRSLRDRVDETEQALVQAFNDIMETVVQLLGYRNLTRAWLERKSGAGAADPGAFELHIVRETTDGNVYEDSVATLSESEREVVGLVVGLTGYLVHRVYEKVPFIVLDSVEAIDASRIENVLNYFGSRTGFLVAALLPEDANSVLEQDGMAGADRPPLARFDAEVFN
jgi:peptidoglycan hydrolase CwlO-like protein